MHDGINHWVLSFNSNGRVQVCDSLHETLGMITKRRLKGLYKSFDKDEKLSITMIQVRKLKNSSSCGLFAIALATNILEEISPAKPDSM